MKISLHRSDYFVRDFTLQYGWYLQNAGDRVATRFLAAVEFTLLQLIDQPGLGRQRNFRHPALQSIRSFRVRSPFEAHLNFYRLTDPDLFIERLMHGRRDRLAEPPTQA